MVTLDDTGKASAYLQTLEHSKANLGILQIEF